MTSAPQITQEQAAERRIDGVVVQRLAYQSDDHRGTLLEVVDPAWPFWHEPIVYSYAFSIRAGRIKGWGCHRLQADRYFVSRGHVRVVLFDGREGSPTRGRIDSFFFSERTPGLLRIPPGVWHAAQNLGTEDVQILNFPTVAFDHAHPDKERIDPHSGEIPFDWSLPDG